MSYGVEWIGGGVFYGVVLVLMIVPEFAAIAVVVATIAVLVGALASGIPEPIGRRIASGS